MKTKSEIRHEISVITKETLPKDDYGKIHSINTCKIISTLPDYNNADILFVYMALPDEVDLLRLIVDAFVVEKKVCIPKIDPEKKEISFHEITPGTKLSPGGFNVLETTNDETLINLDELINNSGSKILALVPGRAFTKDGKRLGRGGGYYDKFLQKYGNKIMKIGVCFPFQILDELPVEENDFSVEKVISA